MTGRREQLGTNKTFEIPTTVQWGLTPDEQVTLFGDQGPIDAYSSAAYTILAKKHLLGVRYVASFWPKSKIPKPYWKKLDENNTALSEFQAKYPTNHPTPAATDPLLYPILQDFEPKYHWLQRDKVYDGAATKAVEYARAQISTEDDPVAAEQRLTYVLQLVDEWTNYGWRGDMRTGGGGWVEFPPAPWHVPFGEFPMGTVETDMLF